MKETARGTAREYTYVGGGGYSAPIVAITQGGLANYYYLLHDYLGRVLYVVDTDNLSSEEYRFDAWGRRRVPKDWDN